VQQHLAIIELLTTILGKNGIDNITTTSWEWDSTECQWSVVLHHGQWVSNATVTTDTQNLGCLSGYKCCRWYHCHVRKMSIHGAPTLSSHVLWIPKGTVQQHQLVINVSAACIGQHASDDVATTSLQCASMEHQQFLVLHPT
jgi:hypothetical protein